MKKNISILISLFCLGTSLDSNGQVVGTGALADVFLKGNHVEVGVANTGAFGSNQDAPAGFHPRGGPDNTLGFVSDPDEDGWTVGTPDYIGCYFLPGSPQEGWDVQIDGNWNRAWRSSWPYDGFSSGSGPLLLTGENIPSIDTLGKRVIGTWEGTMGDLAIKQRTVLDTTKLFFVMEVDLKNTGTDTLNDVYYQRTVDPDNEVAIGGSFVTTNNIVYQPSGLPGADMKALVSAYGSMYPTTSYLGLGAKDCRARVWINNSWSLTPTIPPDDLWDGGAGHITSQGGTNTNDVGIGIIFNVGDIAPGDSTTVSYAYILRESDLDSAFQLLGSTWNVNGGVFDNGDTVYICRGSELDVSISGGGAYVWGDWTPSAYLTNTSGRNNTINIAPDMPVTTYTVIGTTIVCPTNDTLTITIEPVGDSTVISQQICAGNVFDFDGTIVYESGTYFKTYQTGQLGCDSVVQLNLTVNPLPDVKVSAPETTICSDETALFQLENPSSYATYQWYKDGVAIPGATEHQYMADAVPGEYRVVGVTNKGCTDTSRRITLTVNPAANVDILDVDYGKVCLGDTITFEAELQNGYEYRWTPEKVFRYTSGYKSNIAQGIMEDPETIVTVMGMNKYGCKDYDSVKVVAVPCCEVLMPTVFSPNGDGLNDWFNIKMQNNKQIVVSFQVFDRRGNLVYDNNNQKQGWNGLIENTGSEANQATYFYRVVYTCTDGTNYEVKGDITLVR